MNNLQGGNMQTFEEHLEVLRKMLFRMVIISLSFTVVLLGFKDVIFDCILAPCSSNFSTFQLVKDFLQIFEQDIVVCENQVELIATDISSQFMAHLSVTIYLGILFSSPYMIYEIFRYISPALYENEKKYSFHIVTSAYMLFIVGLLVSYFVIFPISCRFLATYSVSSHVHTMITLDSYLSLFFSMTLTMGIVFQLPIISLFLTKLDLIDSSVMKKYRKHAFVLILVVSAIITPPDAMTLLLVAFPLYSLFEFSIAVIRLFGNKKRS